MGTMQTVERLFREARDSDHHTGLVSTHNGADVIVSQPGHGSFTISATEYDNIVNKLYPE